MTYPNGRELTYSYGSSNEMNDLLSRTEAIIDDDTTNLVAYDYLGQGSFVIANESQPNLQWTLADLTGTNDPTTGDIYSGLDRFGRMKDCRWYNTGSSSDAVRLKYGYDRNSNRLWREDLVAQANSQEFDEYSTFDGLNRLQTFGRGLLNGTKTGLTTENFANCWNMDKNEVTVICNTTGSS